MIHLTISFDLESLREKCRAAALDFETDVGNATYLAAQAGIAEAVVDHPYTDRTYHLTDDAKPARTGDFESAMIWPVEYASFVDRGTSRSAPYPFTPQALARAEESLRASIETATFRLRAHFSGG